MNIDDIRSLDHNYPVPLVDRCKIKKIGDAGTSQVITLSEGKSILRVVLKCKDHFLDPDEDAGKWLKIKSGKPVKNKPTGIKVAIVDEKVKIIVTSEATLSLTTEADETEVQLTEEFNNAKPKLEEDEELPLLSEGPSDDFIISNMYARAHLYNLFEREEMKDPTKFTFVTDKQTFITSLYMDCISTGRKILPVVQKEKKERFAKYEKPPVEKPESNPVEESNKILNSIEEAVRESKLAKKLKAALSKNGVSCYDLLLDPIQRPKTYRWFWMNRLEDCGKLEPMRDALRDFYATLTHPLKKEVCREAVQMDVSILCKIPYDGEEALNACLAEIMKDMKAKEIGSTFCIEFFEKLKEARTIDYPITD